MLLNEYNLTRKNIKIKLLGENACKEAKDGDVGGFPSLKPESILIPGELLSVIKTLLSETFAMVIN